MSKLQAALLVIGIGVMLAVYLYGWWQQRRLSRKFGETFKTNQGDALFQPESPEPVQQDTVQHTLVISDMDRDDIVSDEHSIPYETRPITAVNALDESCTLLKAESDFIIELKLREPAGGAILGSFWQRKFDFGKPVQVCGLTLQGGRWERVIAESQSLYSSLRIALQMVDRGGVINVTKLSDFRDLVSGIVRQIQAEAGIPDLDDTYAQAVELDKLCAQVDQMVGINLLPSGGRMLLASRIAQAALLLGMQLESDGAFHLSNIQGYSLFSLINQDTKPFQHHTLETATSAGITLLLDVPRVQNPASQFDQMVLVAQALAKELQLNLVDDQLVVLTPGGLAQIRTKIEAVEVQMKENGIAPGSGQARRLFA